MHSPMITGLKAMVLRERAFLPVSVLLALGVAGVVWWFQLHEGPAAFLLGVLVGSLAGCAVCTFMYTSRLAGLLRGDDREAAEVSLNSDR